MGDASRKLPHGCEAILCLQVICNLAFLSDLSNCHQPLALFPINQAGLRFKEGGLRILQSYLHRERIAAVGKQFR